MKFSPLLIVAAPGVVSLLLLFPSSSHAINDHEKAAKKQVREAPAASSTRAAMDASASLLKGDFVDRIIVSIDGDGLTMSDLKKYMISRGEKPADKLDLKDKKTEDLLHEMVNDDLLQREAKAAGLGVGNEEISAYIDEIKRQNRVDDSGLNSILQERGMTYDEYRAQVERDIIKSRVVGLKVRSKINVLDSEIEEYYRAHPELTGKRKAVRVEQIFVADNGDGTAAAEKAAQFQKNAAADPESFSDIYQDGYTDLGQVSRSDLRRELSQALKQIGDNGVTPVIRGDDGFYILRASSSSTDAMPDDADLKDKIRKILTQERYQGAMEQFMKEDLPRKYNVEYRNIN